LHVRGADHETEEHRGAARRAAECDGVYFAFGIKFVIAMMVTAAISSSEGGLNWGSILVLPLILMGVQLLFDVIAMRAIGSYYRCFKHKFAWSWG
jgi:hypothetical protein